MAHDKRGNRLIVAAGVGGKLLIMPTQRRGEKNILITGSAEFIRCNLADERLRAGKRAVLFHEEPNTLLPTRAHTHQIAGQVFDIGGGFANTTSLSELMNTIGELHGHGPEIRFADWPTADAPSYASNA